jgi:hypothetical protein
MLNHGYYHKILKMKNIYLRTKHFIKNFWFVFFAFRSQPKSFYGYGRFWLARKYADKRTAISSPDGVTARKRHFCFPYTQDIVMVCNRSEINNMIRSKLISHRVDIYYMIEHAYYISK